MAQQEKITAALEAGSTPDEIFVMLVSDGVKTTLTRVQAFCDAFGSQPQTEPEMTSPPKKFYRELEASRSIILDMVQGGCKPLEIWAVLTDLFKVPTTQERVATYVDLLLQETFPAGPIQKSLFEIKQTGQTWEDDTTVLSFGDGKNLDEWTVRDFNQGLGILGATGSGKTSGSGKTIAYELICAGYGGLVLTSKVGEADEWANLMNACKRGGDFSIVRHDGPLRLNLLQYELERPGPGAEFTENLVSFFQNMLSVMSPQKSQVVNQSFWAATGDQLLRNLINCFLMAKQPLTLDGLCEFVANAPTNRDAAKDDKWPKLPVFGDCLAHAREAVGGADDLRVFKMLEQYWLKSYPTLAPETRSCITISFTAMLDALRARHIYDMLSTTTTITPESIFNGRVVVLDLPINEYKNAGLLVQASWLYLCQRAILRRADKPWGNKCRPVFVWTDECQNFLLDFDAEFQARARDCRVARVMLTQNLNCLYERLGGGDSARVKVDAVLGNLCSKIFHANGDPATTKYASDLIGSGYTKFHGRSVAEPNYPGLNPLMDLAYKLFKKPNITHNETQVREPIIQPHEFHTLMTGGIHNDCIVEGIATRVGRPFANGKNHTRVAFKQPSPVTGMIVSS